MIEQPAGGKASNGAAVAGIVRGASVALLGSLVGGGFGFVFTVLMAHLLSRGDFGLIVLSLNLLLGGAALTLAGTDYAAVRFVAAARDPGAKRGAMVTPIAIALVLNGVAAIVTAIFARPIS